MGIIISLRKDNHIVYEDYVCGWDEATSHIADLIYMKINNYVGDKSKLSDDELDELHSLIYSSKLSDSDKITKEILEPLQEYKDRDYKEINEAKNELSALDEARRHCGIYEEFIKFTNEMLQIKEWLENEDYSQAGIMLEIIDKCRSMAERNTNCTYEIWITLSK